MPASFPPDLPADAVDGFLDRHSRLLLSSYQRVTGRVLLESLPSRPDAIAAALFGAPFGLMSHGTEADPIINYGNALALALFEADWADFTGTPSRFTAEPVERQERQALLEAVSRDGYSDSYQGVRISFRGRRFLIRDVTVWNLLDEQGGLRGQAACIREWNHLDR